MTDEAPYSWYNPWPRVGNLTMANKTQAILQLRCYDRINKTYRGMDNADVLEELDKISSSIQETIALETQLLELVSAERMRLSL